MNCPICGKPMDRDYVDIGVGEMPCGPWGCFDCQYVEGQEVPKKENGNEN